MQKIKSLILTLFLLSNIYSTNKIYINNQQNFDIHSIDEYTLEIHVSISEIDINEIMMEDDVYTNITIPGSFPSTKIGYPNLPMLNKLIEIPKEADVRIEIIQDDKSYYNGETYNINSLIIPSQPSISKSKKEEEFVINNDTYTLNQFYKNQLIDINEKGIMRSVKIANLMISPIEYNPITNQFIIHNNLKFKLHFDNANIELTNEEKARKYSPYFEPIFHSAINNYSSIQENRDNDFIENVVSYIIISDPSFEDSLEPFIEWKQKKGFYVTVAYTNEIGSSANAIKNYLQNQYNNPDNGLPSPSFILLVGDTQQIPASYSSGGHVSDLDYCDFTNDNIPDVLCGRFSAQNPNHVSTQVEKTLEYEQYTMPDPSFLSEVLMISGVDANYAPTYGNGQINYGNQYYFNSNNGINSTTFLYPASGSSESQILNTANQGVALINYTAHGWEDGWADPEFNINDVNIMTNAHQYPTMIGNCCLTNAFDSGACFGEALLRKNNGGAIGYIGGSDVTYWNEDFWWGVGSGNINANPSYNNTGHGAYDGMFHFQNEPNWAVVNSAIMLVGNLAVAEANGMDDYYWEIYHLMGDPSLSTYQGIPSNNNINYDLFLPIGSEAIEIQAEPYSYIGLTQNNNLISSGTVDDSGFLVLVFDPLSNPGTLDITVTAQNKIPYFGEIFVASPDGAYTSVGSEYINIGDDNIISLGETVTIELEIENLGNENASNITLELLNPSNNQYINFITQEVLINNLEPNSSIIENLSFYIDQSAPYGHNFTLMANMASEESNWESTYNLNVEPLIEDFNSESFNEFLWEFDGDMNWIIDSNQFIGGSSSAKSGEIDHNMTSELKITMDIVEDGHIKFDKMVSCEDVGNQTGNYYDYLAFYIDNVEQAKWAGEINWSQSSFPVSAGEHTFIWQYNKDQAVTSGDDAAWIDNIIFPPSYYSSILYGDINNDGNINIQDVILSVNIILDSLAYNEAADINMDGTIDVLDVINIVNLILN
tara:strand:+ start:111 stop:3098 length:2988 start_codon:yes stop_codon:yes gene_type:complete